MLISFFLADWLERETEAGNLANARLQREAA
jgi:hypothetical protein